MSVWQCPLCGKFMQRRENAWQCASGHTFDIARSGYVNLLPVSRKRAKNHGDNAVMIEARRHFLEVGYYAPLRDKLGEIAVENATPEGVLLDAGCGEGYYLEGILSALSAASKPMHAYGVDIAKCAAQWASRRVPTGNFAVGSVYHLPVTTQSVDMLLSIFSPLCVQEYRRVLRHGGIFLLVVPAARHLWELKAAIYEKPYENAAHDDTIQGMTLLGTTCVDESITLKSPTDIQNLFQMTPYYYKTGRAEHARLEELETLTTQISFRILCYRVD